MIHLRSLLFFKRSTQKQDPVVKHTLFVNNSNRHNRRNKTTMMEKAHTGATNVHCNRNAYLAMTLGASRQICARPSSLEIVLRIK